MKSAKLIIVLTVVTILAGLSLSLLNAWAEPKIEKHRMKVRNNAVKKVLPNVAKFEKDTINGSTFFIGKNDSNQIVGVSFIAKGKGYQSDIRIMVGMDTSLTNLYGAKILEQAETPGLGSKISEDPTRDDPNWFMQQFQDLKLDNQYINYIKSGQPKKNKAEIKAITGATISSKSVVNIINETVKDYKNYTNFAK